MLDTVKAFVAKLCKDFRCQTCMFAHDVDVCYVFCHQVDPQEKKKKKTGRAKRRIQYNRRFVNVVATFGRKKGPNARS